MRSILPRTNPPSSPTQPNSFIPVNPSQELDYWRKGCPRKDPADGKHLCSVKSGLAVAADHIKHAYDSKVKEAPWFDVGDKVWLIKKHIKTQRPGDKLDHKHLGPFLIKKKILPLALELDLPYQMKIHPVFHINLLEPYNKNKIIGRVQEPPPVIIVDDHPEYEVSEILDSRWFRGSLQYKVDWKGYDASERQWEPAKNVE
jgi:hypothetical protein